jgi:hypothetical protein
MIRRLLPLLLLACAAPALAQNGSFQQWCQSGDVLASVSGISSSNPLMGTYPRCKVSVFITGSPTLATIYSTVTSTPLANPFCANADASFLFFASQSAQYDVTISNDASCNPSPAYPQLPAPFTWNDAAVSGTGGGGGGTSIVLQTSGIVNGNQALLNLAVTTPGLSISNSLGTTTIANTGVLSFTGGAGGTRTGALTPLATDYGAVGWTQTSGTYQAWQCLVTSTCDFTNSGTTGALFRVLPGTATGLTLIIEDFNSGNPRNRIEAGGSGAPVNGWQLFTGATGTGTGQSWSQTDITLTSGVTTMADFNTTLTTLSVPVSLGSTLSVTGNTTVGNITVTGTCTGCATGSVATVSGTASEIVNTGTSSNPVLALYGGANGSAGVNPLLLPGNVSQTQWANDTNTMFLMTRKTDTVPTGNFLLGQKPGGATLWSIDITGAGFFNSLATSNASTAGYLGVEQGPDPLTACQAAAASNVICLFAPTTITAEYGIGLPGTGPSSTNGSILLFPALSGSESLTSFLGLSGSTAANVACGAASLGGMANGIVAVGDGSGCLRSSGVNIATSLPSTVGPASPYSNGTTGGTTAFTYPTSIQGATAVLLDCVGTYKFTTAAESAEFGINFTSAPANMSLNVEIGANATTQTHTFGRQTTNGALVTAAAAAAATGTYYPVRISGPVTTGSSTTFTIQAATSNAAGTLNVDANAFVCAIK